MITRKYQAIIFTKSSFENKAFNEQRDEMTYD